MTETELKEVLAGIRPADERAMQEAKAYLDSLAKPPGSLGRLEETAVQLAGICGSIHPKIGRRRILVLCGGRVSGVVDARTATKDGIGLLMTRVGGEEVGK